MSTKAAPIKRIQTDRDEQLEGNSNGCLPEGIRQIKFISFRVAAFNDPTNSFSIPVINISSSLSPFSPSFFISIGRIAGFRSKERIFASFINVYHFLRTFAIFIAIVKLFYASLNCINKEYRDKTFIDTEVIVSS